MDQAVQLAGALVLEATWALVSLAGLGRRALGASTRTSPDAVDPDPRTCPSAGG
jgi:hypothetical protein